MNLSTPDRSIVACLNFPLEAEPRFPCYVSEKLNGLFCYWEKSSKCFYSKSGMRWNPKVLAHIKPEFSHDLVGELYSPALSLQELTEAVGIGRDEPGPLADRVHLWVFDTLMPGRFEKRRFAFFTRKPLSIGLRTVEHKPIVDQAAFDRLVQATKLANPTCEGLVCRDPRSGYTPGQHGGCIKVKFWRDELFTIRHVIEGQGKLIGCVGSFVVANPYGPNFAPGTMQFTHEYRRQLWNQREKLVGQRVLVKYLNLSDAGIPLNSSVLELETPR